MLERQACVRSVVQGWLRSYPEIFWVLNAEATKQELDGLQLQTPRRLKLVNLVRIAILRELGDKVKIAPVKKLVRLVLWLRCKRFLRLTNLTELSILLLAMWNFVRDTGTLQGFNYQQFA